MSALQLSCQDIAGLQAAEAYIDRFVSEKIIERIANKDATVWGPDAESEAAIRLNWVDSWTTAETAALVSRIKQVRSELVADGINQIILSGMGGSSLAPEVIAATYDVPLTILDSTDPKQVMTAFDRDLRSTAVIVASKSGSTVETDSHRRIAEVKFAAAGLSEEEIKARIIIVTDPGSPFEKMATEAGYREIFLADPHVGGRYSALTAFGLVPTGLAGVDLDAFLAPLQEENALGTISNAAQSLGLYLGAAAARGRDKMILAETSDINDEEQALNAAPGIGAWIEQLVAESTGKHDKGILPVVVEGPEAYEFANAASMPDVIPVALGPVPNNYQGMTISGKLATQFVTWEYATAIAGWVLEINPFDQPDVESAKTAARSLLNNPPQGENPSNSQIAEPVSDSLTGSEIDEILSQIKDNGYVSVMAYLDRLGDARLEEVRPALAARTNRPVTFGWGPRFLHSTGQYHKGGPKHGVFIQIVAEPGTTPDIEIPGQPFTLGTLITAQAAGDAEVLRSHGCHVLTVSVVNRDGEIDRVIEELS